MLHFICCGALLTFLHLSVILFTGRHLPHPTGMHRILGHNGKAVGQRYGG